ncbi:TPA: hypothetical protein ACH3X3_007276 [Trebouxia sp. C0006]
MPLSDNPALESSSTYRRLNKSLKAFAHQFPEDGRRVIQCVEEALLVRSSSGRVDGRCTAQNELQLLESDKEEHAHRSVGRLLRAGTDYKFIDGTSKAGCIESYKMLLGPFFPESGLPSFGGRQFIAGVLATMLQRRIASTDIHKWFYKPTNQDLEVHEELSDMLSQRGLSWPPMLESMSSCVAYSLSSRASASGRHISHTDDAGIHNMHSFQNTAFTTESDMHEHPHEDGTQLNFPSGDLNNELNHCIGDEPFGEAEHLF